MRAISIPHRAPLPRTLVVALALVFGPIVPVWALPDGEQVVAGGVSVARPDGNNMLIQQSTDKAIVNWNGFSIGAAERVQIQQPGASSVILNRVTGASRSDINGTLSANGKVFLVNPNGVVFGETAAVNVGSLVASTLSISNDDFLADNYRFAGSVEGRPDAVSNLGEITVADRGTVALLGGSVSNAGTITARLGTVAMGSGRAMTLDLAGDGLSKLTIERGLLNALVENGGLIVADGGQVVLTTRAAAEIASAAVNQTGIVRARSLSERNGRIVLDSGEQGVTTVNGAVIQVGAGTISTGVVDASGLDAGTRGGEIQTLGESVVLLNEAQLTASGSAGGGSVLVGGDRAGRNPDVPNARFVLVEPAVSIRANATGAGDGGKVVVHGQESIYVTGSLSANAAPTAGNGGLVETSSRQYLDVRGIVVSAEAPAGTPGLWSVSAAGTRIAPQISSEPDFESSVILDATISSVLVRDTDVSVGATHGGVEGVIGDLRVDSGANIQYSGDRNLMLTLRGARDVRFLEEAGIEAGVDGGAGALEVDVNAGADPGSEGGAVSFETTTIVTNGGRLRVSGGSVPDTGFARGRSGDGPIHAVRIDNSRIEAGAGDIEIRGEGRDGADGVRILSSSLSGNNIRITGVAALDDDGPEPSFLAGHGGYYSGDATITADGALDLRGLGQGGAGVHLAAASSLSSGTGVLRVTGYSSSLEMEGLLAESATIGGEAQSADMVLRAGRAGGLDSIRFDSGVEVRTSGILVLAPAGLTADGGVTALDAVPIRIGSSESGGFELDSSDLGVISSDVRAVLIGTDTHTGSIEVRDRVIPSFNLTLQNEGLGSEGIGLADGIALLDRTLALASAGPITSGGSILAEALFVRGAPSHAVTLTEPANSVDRLAVDPPASFSFVNSGPVVIGPIERASFSSTAGVAELITDPVSSSQGDFFVRTLDGALTLTQPIITLDPGSNITLVSASTFRNIGGSLVPGAGGRWRVWADTWVDEQRGGLTPSATSPNFYGCSYDSGVCAGSANLPADGNRFIYADRPTLTVIADDKSRIYGAPNPAFTFDESPPGPLVNGDTLADALSGTLGTTAMQGSPVGGYPIDNAALGLVSPVGYLITVVPGTLTIDRARLLYVANPATRRVGAVNPPFSGTVTGFVRGETVETATDGTLVFSTEAGVSAPSGRYAIDGSGLSAANYYFEQAPVNATALAVTPVDTGNEENSILRPIDESSYIYDRNFGLPPMCFATGPLSGALRTQGGDLLALEWSRVRSRPNLSNCVEVDERNACADF